MLRRRFAILLLACCTACSAQSNSPETTRRIERQVQAYYQLPPGVTVDVGSPKPSDMPGYDLVTITFTGAGKVESRDFLLSKDRNTLVRFTKIDLTKDPYAEIMKKINLQGRPERGNPDAKVTIVNYDDFECPFCSRMHATLMNEILPQYGDRVRIFYKDYPLPMHPWAPHAANDANCLARQSPRGYWDFADYVHGNQHAIGGNKDLNASYVELDRLTLEFGKKYGADANRLQACIKAQSDQSLKASMTEGDNLGVSATPTMFINGQRLEGAVDADELRAVLNQQLREAGVQPPRPVASQEGTSK